MSDPEYWFDEDAADRAENFFPDMLTHVKGVLAGKPFELLDWQKNIVRTLFGWKREDGTRRYRTLYCEVARKNGKSTFAAGLAVYLLMSDGEPGAEVYSAAASRDQASLVYSMARDMIRANPLLAKRVEIRDSVKRIRHPKSGSFYRAVSSDAATAHGYNSHAVVCDEVHALPGRDFYDVLQTSTGSRKQPLMISITTAGHDRTSICWELHRHSKAILSGTVKDDSFLPVIFGVEQDADWTDEEVWKQANPSLGVAVTIDYLREQAGRAKESPAFCNTFRRLHLSQWTEQDKLLIPMHNWDACRRSYSWDDMKGQPCYAGLDLSSTQDATALALVFPDGEDSLKVLVKHWIPEEAVSKRAESDQAKIRSFKAAGHLQTTPGNEIEVSFLADAILEVMQDYGVISLGFDKWNSSGVIQCLTERGFANENMLKMPQTFGTYNEPLKRLLAMLGSGKFAHNGDTVLRWMASNVAGREDTSGNIRPDKGRSADKIDGIVAMLMGIALWLSKGMSAGAYSQDGSGVVFI